MRIPTFLIVFCIVAISMNFAYAGYPCPYDGPADVSNENEYQVENYILDLSVVFPQDPDNGYVEGHSIMTCVSLQDNLQNIVIDFLKDDESSVNSITADGNNVTYDFANDLITVNLVTPLNIGETITIDVDYRVEGINHFKFLPKPPKVVLYAYNAMVESSRWFPCLHDPKDKALYEIRVTIANTMLAACNGTLESDINNSNGTHTMIWIEHAPMATYLATVNISEYVTFGHEWAGIPFIYYVRADSQAAAEYDFQNDDAILDFYDETFGPYPFEKMGLAQVKLGGAMENQDMISYGVISGNLEYEDTFAHEISHMYWGDSVTLTGCEDVWLNEGFASYCEALWEEHFYSDAAYDAVMANFRDRYFNEDANHRFSIYDPEDVWSNTTYRKGAWVLHMLRGITGDEIFFNILSTYYDQYKFSHATTPEFKAVCENLYGSDLDWFFQEWIYKAGYPEFTVFSKYVDSELHLFIQQTQVNAPIFKMPAQVKLEDSGSGTVHDVLIESSLDYFKIDKAEKPLDIVFDPDGWVLSKTTYGTDLPATRCKINMSSDHLTTGDICWCNVYVDCYETAPLVGYPLFVILDVFGELFFAPDFSDYDSYADIHTFFNPGRTVVEVLPEFTWPAGTGSANGIIWYAALVTPDLSSLYGEMDMFSFGWE